MKKVRLLKSFFSKARRNDDGSAAIEFAFTAPLLILTIVGIMEFSMILFLDASIEGSLREAARFGATGYSPAGFDRKELIIERIHDATLGLVPITEDNVTTLVYQNFGDVGKPEPFIDSNGNGEFDIGEAFTDVNTNGQWDADMGVAGLGIDCEVVAYRVETEWPLLLGLLAKYLGSPFKLTASTAIRNEPYGDKAC